MLTLMIILLIFMDRHDTDTDYREACEDLRRFNEEEARERRHKETIQAIRESGRYPFQTKKITTRRLARDQFGRFIAEEKITEYDLSYYVFHNSDRT